MRIRTKFLAAVLATATAFSCALTAAATPAVTLKGNETTPAAAPATGASEATVTLTISEFTDVKGADLEITLMNGESAPDGITVESVSSDNFTLTANENYKIDGNKVKIVDVFNFVGDTISTLTIDINLSVTYAAAIGSYDFSNSTVRLVNATPADIDGVTYTWGEFVIGKKSESVVFVAGTVYNYDEASNVFLPYGVLKNGNDYVKKNDDGSFSGVTGTQVVTCFAKPKDNKVTTFGVSKIPEKTAIQFGSYVDEIAAGATSFGTLVVAPYTVPEGNTNYEGSTPGSFDDVVEYYKNKEGLTFDTTDAVLAHLVGLLVKNNKADGKFHALKYNGGTKYIFLSVVQQNNYMWKNGDNNTKLQYAVRYSGLDETQQNVAYTAVGYYAVTVDTTTTYDFSKEIKTAKYSELG